jgi:hypothetical protein
MISFTITAANVDKWCGQAGSGEFDFGGHRRVLNANRFPLGSNRIMFAKPMAESIEIIPEEQWPDLISMKDRCHSWLHDRVCDLPCKDQNGLGYCHGYGPVTCMEVMREVAGLPYVELSAESVAGRVTRWRNEGGDPEEDLQALVEHGACLASYMDKPHSISPSRWMDGWEENAKLHRAEEVYSQIAGDLWLIAGTCALRNIATSPWFDWWGHCISGSYRLKYDVKTKKIYRLDRNNWGMSWGENGYCWFEKGRGRSQGTPSGIVAVRVATPSEAA